MKKTNNSSNKIIPNVTVTYTKSQNIPIGCAFGRAFAVDYSKQEESSATSNIYESGSPVSIDVDFNPANVFESEISFQISTPIGSVSKTMGLMSESTKFEGNYKKEGNKKKRRVWETGNNFYSFYTQTGKDTFLSNGIVSSDYDRMTVSKLAIATAIVLPEVLGTLGKYEMVKTLGKYVTPVLSGV